MQHRGEIYNQMKLIQNMIVFYEFQTLFFLIQKLSSNIFQNIFKNMKCLRYK